MTTATDLLADRIAVVDTVTAYSTALDNRDWPLFESLFTPDAVWDYSAADQRCTGPAEILARVRPGIERLDATQHFVTNHVVTIAGDEAAHSCYYLAQHMRGGERFLAAGRYRDLLRRTESGWRIASRLLLNTWTDGNPSVVLQ